MTDEIKNHEYHHLKELREQTRLIVYTKNKMPYAELSKDAYAFVSRMGGASYKIFISEFCAGKSFLMHELGHIICQHLRFEDTIQRQVLDRVQGRWYTIKGYIEQDYKNLSADSETIKNFVHLLCNYAMDMEVNSKYFDAEEIPALRFDLTKTIYRKFKFIIENGNRDEAKIANDTLKKFAKEREKNPGAYLATPILAEDFGFERGLHWQQYIDLLLANPDKTMEILGKSLEENSAMYEDFSGSASGSSANPGKALNGKKRIKSGVIKRAASLTDMSDELSAELVPNQDGEDDYENTGRGDSHLNGKTKSLTVHKLDSYVRKFITERAIDEFKDTRPDYLYLSNRGRCGNVMRSKSIIHSEYIPGNIYIIVDTSGSIKETALVKLLGLFDDIKAYVGNDSKVIFWDTELQKVSALSKSIKEIPRGGGTNLTPAIEYVGKRYCKSEDKLFIISDYMDDLNGWYTEIQNLKCPCYGICWKTGEMQEKALDRFFGKGCFKRFIEKVDTLFVKW